MENKDGKGLKGEIIRHMRPQPPRTLGKGGMGRGVAFNSNKMSVKKGNRGR